MSFNRIVNAGWNDYIQCDFQSGSTLYVIEEIKDGIPKVKVMCTDGVEWTNHLEYVYLGFDKKTADGIIDEYNQLKLQSSLKVSKIKG